jgi:hypothetical protein
VRKTKLKSQILNRNFFLNCSTKAIKTIKKYGGLDRYLLQAKQNLIKDSQIAMYIKSILLKKKSDPTFRVTYMPFNSKPKFKWKKRERSEIMGLPSIYIPAEAKRTDLSEMYYPVDYFESRLEKEKRMEVEKTLEQETDPAKRDELKKKLNLEKYTTKMKKDLLSLMPFRHKMIRDGLIRLRDRPSVKLNFLKTIENSENYTKLMLGDQYKHFSEDFPEVQLILQQTEEDKYKKTRSMGKLYKEYSYEFGETYEDSKKVSVASSFDPFSDKVGTDREKPKKRMNAKMIEKIKTRTLKKEKKMSHKKLERKKGLGRKNKTKIQTN